MKTYAKGARSERELLHFLNFKGFAVTRVPSSGGWISPVDVIAIKDGLVLAFEAKAWNKKPKLDRERTERFSEWCRKAGAHGFLAWYNDKKWLFLPMDDVVNSRYEDDNWLEREMLLNVFGIR